MKIKIPEDMLHAALLAAGAQYGFDLNSVGPHIEKDVKVAVEAVLRWLSENPIVPSEVQARALVSDGDPYEWPLVQEGATEWQRRMFVAPEPEVPEETLLEDLLIKPCCDKSKMTTYVGHPEHNEHVLEAYRRGQNSK